MNRIVLIGNGFDLAHKIPTSYTHFLNWYLRSCINSVRKNRFYDDLLIEIKNEDAEKILDSRNLDNDTKDFKSLIKFLDSHLSSCIKSNLLKQLIHSSNVNWVDIESIYFRILCKHYNSTINANFDRRRQISSSVKTLNEEFNFLKTKLIDYLSSLSELIESVKLDPSLEKLFFDRIKPEEVHNFYRRDLIQRDFGVEKVIFINFNYTDLVKRYADFLRPSENLDIKHIHGKINDTNNSPIFGYGDHFDGSFQDIENLNENEFLSHFKFNKYPSYRYIGEITEFCLEGKFQIVVIGHSLGISDRTMLKTLMEHGNCISVKLYCYENEQGINDFTEKIIQASRHFKDKNVMLTKLVPFSKELIFKVNN